MIIILILIFICLIIFNILYYTDDINKDNKIYTNYQYNKPKEIINSNLSSQGNDLQLSHWTKHIVNYKINLVLVSIVIVYLSGLFLIIGYSNFFDNSSEQIINYNLNKETIDNMKNEIIFFINQSFLFNEEATINSLLQILESNCYDNIILTANQIRLINSNIDHDSILETYRLLGLKDYKDFLYIDSSSYWNEIALLDPLNWENRKYNSLILHSLSEQNPEYLNNFKSFILQEIINNHLNQVNEIEIKHNPYFRVNMFKLSLPVWMCLISLVIINNSMLSFIPNY